MKITDGEVMKKKLKRPAMPGAGRPKKPESEKKITIGPRVSRDFKKEFLKLSKTENISQGELIEIAVPFYLNYKKQHPQAFERYLENKDKNNDVS